MATAILPPQKSSIWWNFLLQGLAAMLLGLILITERGAALDTIVAALGFFWVISGMLSFVQIFDDRSVPWIWSLLIGLSGAVFGGILLVRHPLVAALTVPAIVVTVFGIEGLVMGALEFVGGISGGGASSFIRGLTNSFIGLLLLLSSTMTAAMVVLLVFVVLMLGGMALVALASIVRISD